MAPTGPLSAQITLVSASATARSFRENIQNWFMILELLRSSTTRQELLEGLQPTQRVSLHLLEEWWLIIDGSNSDAGRWMLHQEGEAPRFNFSTYQKELFELWELEFGVWDTLPGYPESLESVLVLTRQKAAAIAAAHRIAIGSQRHLSSITSPTSSTQTRSNLLLSDDPLPSCIEACPWLEQNTRAMQYPYYLWDTQEQETVRFPDNDYQYLVVSHTWGRWEIPGQKVQVPGVPWSVPCNELFEVIHLPKILASLQFAVRYVWLDLLCIPQDGSLLQQIEIGRQATIFSSARYAAIWANQIPDWAGLQATVEWLSMKYLQMNERGNQSAISDHSILAEKAQQSTGLARIKSLGDGERQVLDTRVEPDGWFTSLWTLQEACLRPDMFLCDRNMNVMTAPRSNIPMSLGYIIALAKSVGSLQNRLPSGPLELFCVLESSELYNLLDMSALDVIIFGNRRYCRDTSRAVAIMSALGFTDWYNDAKQDQPVESFIEGRYPLEFVREAKTKLGGIFFATMADGLERQFGFDPDRQRIISVHSVGTTLPFRRDLDQMIYCSIDSVGVEDHPSVKSWSIQADGSVHMPQVGVIASWPQQETTDTVANIVAWIDGSMDNHQGNLVGLSQWLGSFRPTVEKYAICLLRRSLAMCCGILLERVYQSSGTFQLVKVGYFSFVALEKYGYEYDIVRFPATMSVDWQVL